MVDLASPISPCDKALYSLFKGGGGIPITFKKVDLATVSHYSPWHYALFCKGGVASPSLSRRWIWRPNLTILYYAMLYYATLHCILHYTITYHTIQCAALLCDPMRCDAIPHHPIPYHALVYYSILYYAIPYHAMPYYTTLYSYEGVCGIPSSFEKDE